MNLERNIADTGGRAEVLDLQDRAAEKSGGLSGFFRQAR